MLKNLAFLMYGLLILSLGIYFFQMGTNKMALSQESRERKLSKSQAWFGMDFIFYGSVIIAFGGWDLRESVRSRLRGEPSEQE